MERGSSSHLPQLPAVEALSSFYSNIELEPEAAEALPAALSVVIKVIVTFPGNASLVPLRSRRLAEPPQDEQAITLPGLIIKRDTILLLHRMEAILSWRPLFPGTLRGRGCQAHHLESLRCKKYGVWVLVPGVGDAASRTALGARLGAHRVRSTDTRDRHGPARDSSVALRGALCPLPGDEALRLPVAGGPAV